MLASFKIVWVSDGLIVTEIISAGTRPKLSWTPEESIDSLGLFKGWHYRV